MVSVLLCRNRHHATRFCPSGSLKPTPKYDKFRRLGHTIRGVRNDQREACAGDQEGAGKRELAVRLPEAKTAIGISGMNAPEPIFWSGGRVRSAAAKPPAKHPAR